MCGEFGERPKDYDLELTIFVQDRTYEPAMLKLMEGYCMPREHNRTVNSYSQDLPFFNLLGLQRS